MGEYRDLRLERNKEHFEFIGTEAMRQLRATLIDDRLGECGHPLDQIWASETLRLDSAYADFMFADFRFHRVTQGGSPADNLEAAVLKTGRDVIARWHRGEKKAVADLLRSAAPLSDEFRQFAADLLDGKKKDRSGKKKDLQKVVLHKAAAAAVLHLQAQHPTAQKCETHRHVGGLIGLSESTVNDIMTAYRDDPKVVALGSPDWNPAIFEYYEAAEAKFDKIIDDYEQSGLDEEWRERLKPRLDDCPEFKPHRQG
ncbi:MAG: hypothetical protein AAGL49_04525 [Pseudomonadota bacterium]